MSIVIACQGEKSGKIIAGKSKTITPFVGADREGELASLGIGFIQADGIAQIWGLFAPHALIQCWRAMKLFEKVPRINHGTLCACWELSGHRPQEAIDARYRDEIANQLSGQNELNAVRKKLLTMVPDAAELHRMLTNLHEKGVRVDSWELEQEVTAGRVVKTDLMYQIAREEETRQEEYLRQQEEIKKPVPPMDSLGVFFKYLGLGNFCVGDELEWNHIQHDQLDSCAKSDSYSKYLPDGFQLQCTTAGPDGVFGQVFPNATVGKYGEFGEPTFVAADGTKYTFLSAKFEVDQFYLKTKIERPDTEQEEVRLTVRQLRDRIGQIPAKPGLIARVLATLTA